MTKVHGRVLTSVLVLFALVVAVVGVQPAGAASSTVTIGATLAPPTLDLTRNAAAGIPEVLLYNVYEGLVKLDKAGKIKPLLAQSWTLSKNGLVYTFTLHAGVRFQNGDPLTADDVVFSFERVLHPPPHHPHPHADDMAPVKSVQAVGPTTVRVTLKQRSHGFMGARSTHSPGARAARTPTLVLTSLRGAKATKQSSFLRGVDGLLRWRTQ